MSPASGSAPVRPARPAPNPLSLSIDPRERLMVLEMVDDPHYAALELQVFDEPERGRGLLALLERRDGLVDFYRAPTLRLDRQDFSVGRGVAEWAVADFAPAVFDIACDGVVVDVAFRAVDGRRIELRVDDRDGKARRRASLLAPVGAGVEQPASLFAVVMLGFDLVRTSGQQPHLSIGGQQRRLTSLPGGWLHRRRMIRYSAEPIIAVLNPRHDGPLGAVGPAEGIDRLAAGEGVRSAALQLEPPFPNLAELGPTERRSGTWGLDVADQYPLFGGTWAVERAGQVASITMDVTLPWRPRQRLPWFMRLVTTVAKVFRSWPTTYRWSAEVGLASDPPTLRSCWSRKR